MILTASYTTVQANSEETFLGWRHFVHELNLFLNKNVTKDPHGLEYATLGHGIDPETSLDQAVISVWIGEDHPEYDPKKLILATEYFLGEHNLNIIKKYQEGYGRSIKFIVSGLSRYELPVQYQNIKNTWMKNALLSGTVIDVRQVGVEIEPGVFKLNHYVPATQYVDPEEESFIYSIGKDKDTGEILASYDTRFYGDDDYETLYLQ